MERATVEVDEDSFRPVRQQIESETATAWRNVGPTPHVVDSVQFHKTADQWYFRTQRFQPRNSAVYTSDEDGIYEFDCGIQGENIRGVVLVGDVSLAQSLPGE